MTEPRDPVAEAIRLLGEDRERGLTDHPEAADLVAYHRGELPPEAAARIEEHLAWCREDAALLVDLAAAFGDEEAPAAGADPRAAWQRLAPRLAEVEKEEVGDVAVRGVPPGREPSPLRTYALAASVLVAIGALAWAVVANHQLAETRRPRLNVPVYQLAAPGTQRSVPAQPTRVFLGRANDRALLILDPSSRVEAGRFRLRIVDPKGVEVFSGGDLVPTEFGNFTLELTRGFLAPGAYAFELWSEGGTTPLDRFAVEVVDGPAPPADP